MTATVSIRAHTQISDAERERRANAGGYLNDRYYDTRRRSATFDKDANSYVPRASYLHKRSWSNSGKDRHNGGYKFCGPGWMLPKVIATVTASIVWGVCGKMADIPEY